MLDLSIGTTRFTSPVLSALKQQSHEAPVASPERIRNTHVFPPSEVIFPPEPFIKTISHEKSSTITVRTAVAASESLRRIPHFASIAVIPAKNADPKA